MIIKNMRAKFGSLDGESLELHEGLNIIYRDNEGGKSTWCAFIRCMLYGIDTSKRAKAGVLPDKIRNMPWDGSLPAGVMELEALSESITIRRASKTANSPLRDFSAVYTGTETPYPLFSETCGEELTGATSEVFSRSVFIEQGKIAVDNAPDLEAKIASIVSTGELGLSYSEIDDKLASWSRRRIYNKNIGIIPELMAQNEDLSQKLFEIEKLQDEQNYREQKLAQLMAETDDTALTDDDEVSEDVLQCEENERSAKQLLMATRFGIITPREARVDAAQFIAEVKKHEEKGAQKYPVTKLISAVAVLAMASLLYFFGKMDASIYMAFGLFFASVCALAIVNSVKINKSARDARAKMRSLLKAEKIEDIAELEPALQAHEKAFVAWNESVFELKETRRLWEIKKAKESFMQNGQNSQKISDAREKLAEIKGKISATGDAVDIKTKKLHIKLAVEDNRQQYDELVLAREMLAIADRQQQEDFSPALTALAKKHFCQLTDNRYDDLVIDRSFGLYGKIAGDVLPHSSAYASTGARELMYLSLRLALAEMTTKADCPIILDDALCNLDKTRTGRVMTLLEEIAKRRQVIVFTCHRIS